ncbi:MAG: hypothetical protein WB586_20020 [Chthoniobacterales bacterium]
MKLATDYLSCYPSDFSTLRDLRNRETDPPAKTREGYLAVHRHNNMLYKRLEPEAFVIRTALSRGVTLEDACAEALYMTN